MRRILLINNLNLLWSIVERFTINYLYYQPFFTINIVFYEHMNFQKLVLSARIYRHMTKESNAQNFKFQNMGCSLIRTDR